MELKSEGNERKIRDGIFTCCCWIIGEGAEVVVVVVVVVEQVQVVE